MTLEELDIVIEKESFVYFAYNDNVHTGIPVAYSVNDRWDDSYVAVYDSDKGNAVITTLDTIFKHGVEAELFIAEIKSVFASLCNKVWDYKVKYIKDRMDRRA